MFLCWFTKGLKACNSGDWYKSSGAPIPLRLHGFAPSLKKHMSISGGIFLHFNFPFITTRILCYKIMLPSRTNRGVVQDHKRLRAVDSGGNTAWIGSSSSSSQSANAGFDSVATNGENEILSDGWKMHSEQILKVSELEADSKLGHEVSPSKTCTHEGFSRKCEDNGSPKVKKDAEIQLSPQQTMRMETNKAIAKAKRIQKICEEKVAESREKGIPYPKLEDLLVERTWLDALPGELQKPYMEKLSQFVTQEARGTIHIYPPPALVFNALNICPFDKVKVVIIGQDPYHGPGQAMGLCFSVPKGFKMPSSLVNIFKEIQQDVGYPLPTHGNLERWAIQGVLLLNTVLTVREHQANSHAKRGWEVFTDAVIRALSLKKSGIIFILWGNSAQEKIRIIDTNKHHILKAAHPSGLSAHRGFFQCRHFSQANKILERLGSMPIDWQI